METKIITTESLTDLRNKILSGRSALDENQLQEIGKEFNELIFAVRENNLFGKNKELEKTVLEIFSAAIPSQIAPTLMSKTDTTNYFRFGEFLMEANKEKENKNLKKLIFQYLNLFRLPEFLKKIYDERKWDNLIYELIKTSNFTVRELFEQRLTDYENKTLFNVLRGKVKNPYTWKEIDEVVKEYRKALIGLLSDLNPSEPKVAFLMENSLIMVELDLTCLTSGVVNIMIPANSVPQHIEFILNQTKAEIVFASNEKQLSKIKSIKNDVPHLRKVILIEGSSAEEWVITLNEFLEYSKYYSTDKENELIAPVKTNSLATIMYTSGTTGEPKGIMFSQMNIVYKRFCRAMALPEIGEQDRFLSYLPLYHTFGRWLEMMGSIFWAASYSFMENPSLETMLENMQMVRPTIFISIPKKWIQLYEYIGSKVNIELDDELLIKNTVKETTGGSLRWGLSAAGYLPSEIFRFFQKNGIELMSGFGMTEATGGITMTPPGEYIPDSLGKALPGIEIKVAEDGELLIRGPYVMMGYYNSESPFDGEGWFPTGDIMKEDENGFIEIIDRKKEIYKNIKGETIAPQRIENYFRDFENIKQVFLVGDHRPFNTVLIYPDYEMKDSMLKKMSDQELKDYFASAIVSVNKFLAPFERIVDFRIIDRPFAAEYGELTPKGTYKRRVIEKNFKDVIDEMYTKNHTIVFVDNIEIRVPNWFLREKGCLSTDIIADENGIAIPKLHLHLTVKKIESNNVFRIGDYDYKIDSKRIELQELLTNPLYWCGNKNLFQFAGENLIQWQRQYIPENTISIYDSGTFGTFDDADKTNLSTIINGHEKSLEGIHYAVLHLRNESFEIAEKGLEYFSYILTDETDKLFRIALHFVELPFLVKNIECRRKLFRSAIPKIKTETFYKLLRLHLEYDANFLVPELNQAIIEESKGKENLETLEKIIFEEVEKCSKKNVVKPSIEALFDLITRYGIRHPARYSEIRRLLASIEIRKDFNKLAGLAARSRNKLKKGFRNWLGQNESVAIDVETGEEYEWKDVIILEETIPDDLKERIIAGITECPVLREAVFHFSQGIIIRLDNILPGGIWVSMISNNEIKATFRVTIQTRLHGSFELLLTLNKGLTPSEVKKEIRWLIIAGTKHYANELVEDFGGYYKKYDLWTQKYLPGNTVAKIMERELRRHEKASEERLYHLWPYFVWNASAAYVNFWQLTENKLILANPTIKNFIIPSHDYQTGTRIVSLSEKKTFTSFTNFFKNFYVRFIKETENMYPFVHRDSIWNYVFSGVINAKGEKEGLEIIGLFGRELKKTKIPPEMDNVMEKLQLFLNTVEEFGYIPKRLYFAIKRFHRWFKLNKDAALEAQASMLYELYDTYNLSDVEKAYPETRARFFLETCFADSSDELKNMLRELIKKEKEGDISQEQVLSDISKMQNELKLTEKEAYFLTRLSYPYLKPSDTAKLLKIKEEGSQTADLVVQLEDYDGNPYIIRKPISPKEISRLHNLFLEANLQVHFRPEHQFLVALSERGYLIGGLFYVQKNEEAVHMEKIVVANPYRRKGISEGLMNEFFNRLIVEKVKYVTTGFFRPEYFYRFGFKIEKKYSGLVKILETK